MRSATTKVIYGGEFFPADDGLWVLRLAVISMGPVDDTPLST